MRASPNRDLWARWGDNVQCRSRATLTIAQTEVFSESGGQEKLIALLTATLMAIEGREGVSD
jgi:hypothetical protein